jgi:hypothetical protein
MDTAIAFTCCAWSRSQFHSHRSSIMAPTHLRIEMLHPSLGVGRESDKMGIARSRDKCFKQDAGALCKSQDLSNVALKMTLLSITSRELRITSSKTPQSFTGTTCSNKLSGKRETDVRATIGSSYHELLVSVQKRGKAKFKNEKNNLASSIRGDAWKDGSDERGSN